MLNVEIFEEQVTDRKPTILTQFMDQSLDLSKYLLPSDLPLKPNQLEHIPKLENLLRNATQRNELELVFERCLQTGLPLGFKQKTLLQNSQESSVDFKTELDSVAPGLDRGLFGNQKKHLDLGQLMQETEQVVEESEEEEEEEKDVDDLLPDTLSLIQPKKPKSREWAHMIDVNQAFPEFYDLVPEMAHEFPFELDVFQKRAVYHLENGESVFIAAHTSAGKTVVAEYAIALAQKHMTRAIYTSPIKALSNQKFRDFKNVFEDVGILTGDVQINPEGACLVMTTEILRSMLYRGADLIRDVEFVIFDEVHYVNDVDRGVVWEEVIIMLPPHITLILLSATVPNTREFADWVGRTKQKDIYVISTLKRPVPLEHYMYSDKKLYKIVDSQKRFQTLEYKKITERKRDKNVFIPLTQHLKKFGLLPCIVFSFSKKKCEEYASLLSNIDFTSGQQQKSEIHLFFERSLGCLKGTDKQLPQVRRLRDLLSRGIAVHHGGLLPILKEAVEILFTRGLVQVLFATETFAMGVNAPAKTVVFSNLRKHDGTQFRNLLPGEYTQMSGRAGRRGLDKTGMVIIAEYYDQLELQQMILGTPTRLVSQFRVTYNMILNLLRVEAIKVEDMIKRSFSENDAQKHLPDQSEIKQQTQLLESIPKLQCSICTDLEHFYNCSSQSLLIGYQMMEFIMKSVKVLTPGRLVLVNTPMYRNCLGLILKQHQSFKTIDPSRQSQQVQVKEDKSYHVLMLKAPESAFAVQRVNLPKHGLESCEEILPFTAFALITPQIFKLDDNPLLRMYEYGLEFKDCLPEQDWSKIRNMDFQHLKREKQQLLDQMNKCKSRNCPDLDEHYDLMHNQKQLEQKIQELQFTLSDQNLELLPDYHQRVLVLERLGFVENQVVQTKGRVACEINTADELLLTELVLDNFFGPFEPEEIVALLSLFVFQEKSESEPVLTPRLEDAVSRIQIKAQEIALIQRECGLDIVVQDYINSLKLGLVEVVYEWARGLEFKKITDLTDVLEGSIVRCIVRLSETCREVSSAARLVGDTGLYKKMELAQEMIKRDVVFAASLYF
ncbi:NUC185 domain-containing protein [Gorgonomyces haynaldii]|nr:NUC185 domain-containing protein [Gorgonomyces haynaldii]